MHYGLPCIFTVKQIFIYRTKKITLIQHVKTEKPFIQNQTLLPQVSGIQDRFPGIRCYDYPFQNL